MNLLEIIVIAVAFALAMLGYHRGFVKKLAAMVSLMLSITLVSAVLPYVTDFIKNSTPIYHYLEEECREIIDKQIFNKENELSFEPSRIEQTEIIEGLPLPDFVTDRILDYNNEEGYRSLAVTDFEDYIVSFIATLILNVISFLAAVLLVQIALRVAIAAMDVIARLPVINSLNHIAGFLLGILEALFLLWIFFLILSVTAATEWGTQLMAMVESSKMLSYLYNSNLFMQIILRAASLFL